MPLKNRIKEILSQNNLTSYRFWKDLAISRQIAYRICEDPNYIPSTKLIAKICLVYRWQPGDFLVYDFSDFPQSPTGIERIPPQFQSVLRSLESIATDSRNKLTPQQKISLFLEYNQTKSSMSVLGTKWNIHPSTVCRIINQVSSCIKA